MDIHPQTNEVAMVLIPLGLLALFVYYISYMALHQRK